MGAKDEKTKLKWPNGWFQQIVCGAMDFWLNWPLIDFGTCPIVMPYWDHTLLDKKSSGHFVQHLLSTAQGPLQNGFTSVG